MSVFASKARNVAFLLGESKLACSTRSCSSNNATSSSLGLGLRGVFSPITTPFHEDESIAWPKLEANLGRWNEVEGLRGYLVQGSNGEYCYLNGEERVAMIDKVRQWAATDKLVLAGSGCESTKDTVEMTAAMAKAGADVAVVITPCYFKNRMTEEALYEHYIRVADTSPIPVVLYSVPATTGLDLSVSVIQRLASHPNIIGIKDSGGDISKIAHLVHVTKGQNFQILAGSAGFLLPALSVGAVGGICALANVLPSEVSELQKLHEENKVEEAKALQHRLLLPNATVTKGLGVPALKKSMDWLGYYGGPVRRPLLPLSESEEAHLRKIFCSEKFL